jgi:hypothetical protein
MCKEDHDMESSLKSTVQKEVIETSYCEPSQSGFDFLKSKESFSNS